ncbi:MAG: 7-cyano-7-deazaguanine synthase, partial [Cyanobacteria bacterium REEB65]|nr:7-cyano-7-deazaguanine synthase [Cyanobacteria bacterium REEB65]
DLPMADLLGAHWSMQGAAVPDQHSEDAAVYLPGRNLLLLAKAAVLAVELQAEGIALGTLGGNPFSDATAEFRSAMGAVCSQALAWPIEVIAPFAAMSKQAVLELGRQLPLELTFSCLAPQGLDPCGACNKCAERQRAFAEAGIPDRTPYAIA